MKLSINRNSIIYGKTRKHKLLLLFLRIVKLDNLYHVLPNVFQARTEYSLVLITDFRAVGHHKYQPPSNIIFQNDIYLMCFFS